MPNKLKLTVSLDEDVVEELKRVSQQTKKPRSQLVQEALTVWRRKEIQDRLADGYREMSEENREMAEQNLPAFEENLK